MEVEVVKRDGRLHIERVGGAGSVGQSGRRRSNVINQVPHDPSKRTMISLDGGRFTVTTIQEASKRKLYPGLMSKARYESIKMAQLAGVEFDGSDFSVLKPYNPKWIESSYWEDMIDRVWNKRWKLWKHYGGSIVVSLLKRRLENELHISPTPAEVFELTHT
ncbi:hypothetical protein Tco_0848000 [Tanacetum coccineum]